MLHHVERGIERRELLRGGVELFAANVVCGVNDLALQIAGVHHVEVDEPEGADAGRGEIEREGRAEPAGADAENARGFQLALALHAHFRQDEVARIAGEIVGGELGECDRFSGRGCHVSSQWSGVGFD